MQRSGATFIFSPPTSLYDILSNSSADVICPTPCIQADAKRRTHRLRSRSFDRYETRRCIESTYIPSFRSTFSQYIVDEVLCQCLNLITSSAPSPLQQDALVLRRSHVNPAPPPPLALPSLFTPCPQCHQHAQQEIWRSRRICTLSSCFSWGQPGDWPHTLSANHYQRSPAAPTGVCFSFTCSGSRSHRQDSSGA
jgi:hypothetical protein